MDLAQAREQLAEGFPPPTLREGLEAAFERVAWFGALDALQRSENPAAQTLWECVKSLKDQARADLDAGRRWSAIPPLTSCCSP